MLSLSINSKARADFPARNFTNCIGIPMLTIPRGEFLMGNSEPADKLADLYAPYCPGVEHFTDEYPCHKVKITHDFYLAAYLVTLGQFRKFVRETNYQTEAERTGVGGWGFDGSTFSKRPEYNWQDHGFEQNEDHPVVNVSWNDAMAFCGWLTQIEGYTYRLPSEAEWEYACRAGTVTRYFIGDSPNTLVEVANIVDESSRDRFPDWTWAIPGRSGFVFTSPVGRFRPNAFGLYDMHGNVFEWCSDWYSPTYYHESPIKDPAGPTHGEYRSVRGGSWHVRPDYARSAERHMVPPADSINYLGFRLAIAMKNALNKS